MWLWLFPQVACSVSSGRLGRFSLDVSFRGRLAVSGRWCRGAFGRRKVGLGPTSGSSTTNEWFLLGQRGVPPRPTGGSSWTNGVFLQDQRVVPLGPAESSFPGLLPNLSIFRSSFILRSIPIRCYPIGVLPQSVQLHKEAGCRVLTQSSLTLEAVWNSFFSATINVRVSAGTHARTRLPVQRA